jgi:amino acid adenylation domain-containing protein/non-ribosomal peptide synthase protein (TIGR01720 family)
MKNEIEHIFPANSLQQGFIYHALSQPEDDAYRVQWSYDYRQALDIGTYLKAWEYCIRRYPILRTAFNWEEDIIQIVYKHGQLEYEVHDISHLSAQEDKDAAIAAIQAADRRKPFDLTRRTLLRVQIVRQTDCFYTVLICEHHSITDGWSGPLLLATLHEYYDALAEKREIEVREDTAYIRAQEYIFHHKQAAQEHWSEALADIDGANDINALCSRPIDLQNYRRVEQPMQCSLSIRGVAYRDLRRLCRAEGLTLNVIVQLAWHKILQIYSNAAQSIVGTTISGRDLPIEGIEESVGLYINTLPLVVDWDHDNSVLAQLHEVQRRVGELNAHGFADLAKLQRNGGRLFHTLCIYENYPSQSQDRLAAVSFRNFSEKVDYPFCILATGDADALTITLAYDARFSTTANAKQVLSRLEQAICDSVAGPGQCHWALTLLRPEEVDQIVHALNDTDRELCRDRTLHELFQLQAERTPDHLAVVCGNEQLTYDELNARSNQLARCIRNTYQQRTHKELAPDTPVALYLDRTQEMVIGILAVLKAGGVYVPMDLRYRQARTEFVISDTKTDLVLCQRRPAVSPQALPPADKVLYVDLDEECYRTESTANLPPAASAGDLAYIIYTSGTTGNPKGVMLEHRSVVNLVAALADIYDPEETARASAFASYTFDIAASEIFASLLHGLELHVLSEQTKADGDLLSEYLIARKIHLAFLPPAMLGQMPLRDYPDLRKIVYAGEPCDKRVAGTWSRKVELFNYYGPTETCIYSTGRQIVADEVELIGRPIQNTRCFILNPGLGLVPAGVAGELYISGAGVARRYLNQPGLTETRFIQNPWADATDTGRGHARLYRTGDFVRWTPDGNLEYIGRSDDQVKIRGYRVELGEINHALSRIGGITESCVVARARKTGSGVHRYLVAYYARDRQHELSRAAIMECLSQTLPDYMVPSVYVEIDALPLTSNGKIDRKALPEPERDALGEIYIGPTSDMEAAICQIWQEVLGLERVGITDNFFEMGGDSILNIQATGRIRQAGFTSCTVNDIFKYRTVAKLACFLAEKNAATAVRAEQGALSGTSELLPVQQWFFEMMESGLFRVPGHWNQSFLARVTPIGPARLAAILEDLVAYHDVLRSHFVARSSADSSHRWTQVITPRGDARLRELDVSRHTPAEVQEVLTAWQSGFDLEQGSLLQTGYLYGYPDGSARIFLAGHHLVLDAVSWRIIVDDIRSLAEGRLLPPKRSSYRQWAQGVRDYRSSHAAEAAFWKQQLAGMRRLQIAEAEEAEETLELDAAGTRYLLQTASGNHDIGINDLLLTALGYALRDIDGEDSHHVTLEGHGREDIDPALDVSRTVGWFTTMFPVRLDLKNDVGESIRSVGKQLQGIPKNGIGFGAFAVSADTPFGLADLPPVSFNYLGQFDAAGRDWQVTAETAGNNVSVANRDPFLVNINGMMADGKLELTVAARIGSVATARLSSSFREHLVAVAEYCSRNLLQAGHSLAARDGAPPVSDDTSLKEILDRRYEVDFNPPVRIDSAALVLVTAPTSDQSTFFIEHVMNGEAVLEHVLDTFLGKIGIICVPLENMNVYADRAHTLLCVKKGLRLAARLGAQTVSLTGLIPSSTSYGEAILEAIDADGSQVWPQITTGNTTTVSACVMMIDRIQREARRSLSGERMSFIGLGSIGSGTLQLMLRRCPHPQMITLVDLKSKGTFLRRLESQMRTELDYRGEIDIIELVSDELPARVYDSTLFFGAASTGNILDISRIRPGTLIVDDSDPHCFDADLAIRRFQERHDILFTEGGALRADQVFQSSYNNISYHDSATKSRRKIDYELSLKKDVVMGCVFSSILTARFKDVPLSIGLPVLENLIPTFHKLKELGFEGTDLWCNDYFLDAEKINLFRSSSSMLG